MLKNLSRQQHGGEEDRKRIEYYMKLAGEGEEDYEEVIPPINFT
jgi:hypothetical protein